MKDNGDAKFLSWEQAESSVTKQINEICEKMILDDIMKHNECRLEKLTGTSPRIDEKFKYVLYGVPVFDSTKTYIITPEFKERLPGYKRLWSRIKKWINIWK